LLDRLVSRQLALRLVVPVRHHRCRDGSHGDEQQAGGGSECLRGCRRAFLFARFVRGDFFFGRAVHSAL
jgi:hypothetical protein